MENYNTIEYSEKVKLVELNLKSLASTGINVEDYEIEFNSIVSSVNNERMDFAAGENKLDELLEKLDNYKAYSKALNTCLYILRTPNKEAVTKDSINEAIKEVIENLQIIRTNGITHTKDVVKVLDNLYEAVYQLIKLECAVCGTSVLLNACNDNSFDSVIISNHIIDDIERLKKEGKDVSKIEALVLKAQIDEESKQYYLDKSIIKEITLCKNRKEYVKSLVAEVNGLSTSMSDIDKVIGDKRYGISAKEDRIKTIQRIMKSNIQSNIKSLAFSLIPFALTGSLLVGTNSLAKTISNTGHSIDTTTSIYSTLTGVTEQSVERKDCALFADSFETEETIEVKKYTPWQADKNSLGEATSFNRKIHVWDVSELKLKDIMDYLNMDFASLGYDEQVISETIERIPNIDYLYSEEYTELIRVVKNYEKLSDEEYEKLYISTLVILSFWWIIVLEVLIGFGMSVRIGIIRSIMNLKEKIHRLDSNKLYKKEIIGLEESIKELNEELNKLGIAKCDIIERAKEIASDPENMQIIMSKGLDKQDVLSLTLK